MVMSDTLGQIQSLARAYQYKFHPLALRRLSEFLGDANTDEDHRRELLKDLFSLLQKQCTTDRFVDVTKVNAAIGIQVSKIRGAVGKDSGPAVQVVALEAVPAVMVDDITDELRVVASNPTLDRLQALSQRYLHARRRALHSGVYQKDLKHHLVGEHLIPLVPTTSLEGIGANVVIGVLGLLVRRQDELILEDLRGTTKVTVSASTTRLAPDCFVGHGFLAVVTGTWDGLALKALRIEPPPAERREAALREVGPSRDLFGLAPLDMAAARAAEANAGRSVIVVMAHVHLDRPATMGHLRTFFQKMQERSEAELTETTLVFVGEFTSTPLSYGDASHLQNSFEGSERMRTLFDAFAQCAFTNAPTVASHAHFILVPGPHDLTLLQGLLPQPPIASRFLRGLQARLKRVTLAPNPCRLRFCTHEIVVARQDFLRHLQASEALLNVGPTTVEAGAPTLTLFERVAKTLVDEAHLCPDVRAAIAWKQDKALQLPILPHSLFLCDSTEQWECTYKGVHVINPGSFTVNTTFVWYTPGDGECTLNSLE